MGKKFTKPRRIYRRYWWKGTRTRPPGGYPRSYTFHWWLFIMMRKNKCRMSTVYSGGWGIANNSKRKRTPNGSSLGVLQKEERQWQKRDLGWYRKGMCSEMALTIFPILQVHPFSTLCGGSPTWVPRQSLSRSMDLVTAESLQLLGFDRDTTTESNLASSTTDERHTVGV